MKNGKSGNQRPVYGVFTAWLRGQYQLTLISGIEDEARENDVDLFYFAGQRLNSPVPHETTYEFIFELAEEAPWTGS